jgi:glycosyltransferase involved in cell wall biosynthesis
MSFEEIQAEKERILGEERKDNFVCLWMNRNCKRKRPADVLLSWKYFVDMLSDVEREKVTLLLHTNPNDKAGQNLIAVAEMLDITDTLALSTEKLSNELINTIHNISDVCINISYNEGFGLTTLQSMQVGNPIIATKTGGLYRQVIDFEDNTENGVALDPKVRSIAGSQNIPYIYEDYVDCQDAAKAIFKMFELQAEEMELLSSKVEKYAKKAFDYDTTIDLWHESIHDTIQKHESKKEFGLEIVNFE